MTESTADNVISYHIFLIMARFNHKKCTGKEIRHGHLTTILPYHLRNPVTKYCSDIIFRDHLKGSFVRDNDHFVCHTTGATFYNGDIVYF